MLEPRPWQSPGRTGSLQHMVSLEAWEKLLHFQGLNSPQKDSKFPEMKFKFGNVHLTEFRARDSSLKGLANAFRKMDDQTQDYSPFKEFNQLTSLGVLAHLAIF